MSKIEEMERHVAKTGLSEDKRYCMLSGAPNHQLDGHADQSMGTVNVDLGWSITPRLIIKGISATAVEKNTRPQAVACRGKPHQKETQL